MIDKILKTKQLLPIECENHHENICDDSFIVTISSLTLLTRKVFPFHYNQAVPHDYFGFYRLKSSEKFPQLIPSFSSVLSTKLLKEIQLTPSDRLDPANLLLPTTSATLAIQFYKRSNVEDEAVDQPVGFFTSSTSSSSLLSSYSFFRFKKQAAFY
ncbi:hypothetical protein T05_304 [Trichinella murrelli]|uniref:Uncharacterized protein n=1 Tax=Trichinella murrelli TaxID=144512 RepID=A0A0V0U0F4_9BILA|nr:hypothetical protein T05_304 [Trichinella murrelli]